MQIRRQRMDDGKLRALLTAVDCGSFSKAAAQLVVPIPLTLPFFCAVLLCFILLPFYHTATDKATSLLLSGEKVTQKHFHTAAPLWRQYESAFARSRGFFSINLCFTIYNFFIKLCRNFYIIVI